MTSTKRFQKLAGLTALGIFSSFFSMNAHAFPLFASADENLVNSVKTGDASRVKKLLSQGATPEYFDAERKSALFYAAGLCGKSEILKTLIAAGAPLNARNGANSETPLIHAVESGCLENFKTLIAAGAKINVVDDFEQTALSVAVKQSCRNPLVPVSEPGLEMTRTLIEKGANITEVTELTLKLSCLSQNKESILAPLIEESRFNVETKGMTREKALLEAVRRNQPKIAERLIQQGALLNWGNIKGETPLWIATQQCASVDLIKALLAAGADPNLKLGEIKITPFVRAVQLGCLPVATLLLHAGTETTAAEMQEYNALLKSLASE